MDILARSGYVAPVPLYLWFFVAYAVATVRAYRRLGREAGLRVFTVGIVLLNPFFTLFRRDEDPLSTIWWVNYGIALVWPLLIVTIFHLVGRRNPMPYRAAIDVLLFRAPIAATERGPARSLRRIAATGALVLLTLGLGGISYASLSLRPCAWLDLATARSGCIQAMKVWSCRRARPSPRRSATRRAAQAQRALDRRQRRDVPAQGPR